MNCSLWLDGKRLGGVVLGLPDAHGKRTGLLDLSSAYAEARAQLQALTRAVAALAGSEREAVHAHLVSAVASLAGEGLTLRQADGKEVSTQLIMVGDYYAPDIDVALLGRVLPIPVMAWLTEPIIADPAS